MVHLVGQNIGHWKEIVVLGKLLAHEHQILSEAILVSDHVDARPLANALIRFESIQGFGLDREVVPEDIELIGAGWRQRKMLGYGEYSLVIGLAMTLVIKVFTALTDHVLVLVVNNVIVLMLLVEAWIGAPIDEAC